jgi:hypothetical protein
MISKIIQNTVLYFIDWNTARKLKGVVRPGVEIFSHRSWLTRQVDDALFQAHKRVR